jgi:hypothetical protein
MSKCEQCGNEGGRTFEISIDGKVHIFDSFECAIFAVADPCGHCGCRILGHPVINANGLFCCEHCARAFEAAAAGESAVA